MTPPPKPFRRRHVPAFGLGRRPSAGQATTEVVLLFPMFMFFLFAFAKIFAMLILVQKVEIASFYAARRWQLESHRNVNFEGDDLALRRDIENRVKTYIGYGQTGEAKTQGFLDLTESCPSGGKVGVEVQRTQVWQVVTVTVCTKPFDMPFMRSQGYKFERTKYVPNRDRPIAFVLPGLKD